MALVLTASELHVLQWLRAANFDKHGLPEPESREATCLVSALEKALLFATSMLVALDKLAEASSIRINSKALKKALRLYAARLPPLPDDFFAGQRSIASLYSLPVSRAITRREHTRLQDMCASGLLCARDGLRVDFKSHPRLPVRPGKTARVVVRVINAGPARTLIDWDVIGRPLGETELSDRHNAHVAKTMPLVPYTGVFECTIEYTPLQEGAQPCLFIANMAGTHVGLVIPLECASEYTLKEKEGLVPYVPREAVSFDGDIASVGNKPSGWAPSYRSEMMWLPQQLQLSTAIVQAFGPQPVYTSSNYMVTQMALWDLERSTMANDLHLYSMSQAPLVQAGRLVELLVAGLSESKPSVLRGDKIRVRDRAGHIHIGYVHRTMRDLVLLSFSDRFTGSLLPGERFDVEFVLNDLMLHKRYMALTHAMGTDLLSRILADGATFQAPAPPAPHILHDLALRNPQLNDEQRLAISSVLQMTPDAPPFVIFGPPGTGKSSTVVEAVFQVLLRDPASRVLVCAPTNAAADILLVRLVAALGPASAGQILFRANAAYRRSSAADRPEVRDYSMYDADREVFAIPERFDRFRVVVSTLAFSQTVVDVLGGFNNVTHVFVDEAGHADEAESLLCLATVAHHQPTHSFRIILAGDPHQLGPIIHNKLAAPLLCVSLLERIMALPPYQPRTTGGAGAGGPGGDIGGGVGGAAAGIAGGVYVHGKSTQQSMAALIAAPLVPLSTEDLYHPAFVVKLTSNYRSSEHLFHVSAKLFYNGYLRECVARDVSMVFAGWSEMLPNDQVPLVVHGVRGRHLQEKTSPSFFNLEEISLVKQYVTAILGYKRAGMRTTQIGVISPYARQCERIKSLFQTLGWEAIKVGTVEAFQGDERRVIIVSTVRSDMDGSATTLAPDAIDSFLQFDAKHHLGFLRNPKRFNVAVTRAQSLLVLIGNPHVLHGDRHWRALLDYARTLGCYKGVPFNPQPGSQQAQQLHEAFARLELGRAPQPRGDEDAPPGGPVDDEGDDVIEESVPRMREDY